jgi:predicted alpha-1,6-mannanase (GH76 family)
MVQEAGGWDERASQAQRALTARFGPRGCRRDWRNTSPFRFRQAFVLNYWWLAHLIEVRVDAFERTGDEEWLTDARAAYARLLERNHGLFNDYFDDMGWLGIALLRLHRATGERRFLDDAVALWEHIRSGGWNERHGASVAWRLQQLDYKNAPTNGAFALLSARLFAATSEARYARAAQEALGWIESALVDPATGTVADGVNRLGDGRLDADWVFSYNQGLYVGALVEVAGWPAAAAAAAGAGKGAAPAAGAGTAGAYAGAAGAGASGADAGAGGAAAGASAGGANAGAAGAAGADAGRADAGTGGAAASAGAGAGGADAGVRAARTAVAAIGALAPHGVITGENARFDRRGGGDVGLFKGVFVRYLGELIERLPADSPERPALVAFLRTSTDALWSSIRRSPGLRPGDDWGRPAPPATFLSTQLSAVMALETRARLERGGHLA